MLVDSRYHVVNSAFYCGVKQGFTSFNAKLSWSFGPWILTRSCREWTGRSWRWSTWRRWGSTRRRRPGGRRTSGRWCWASWWARAASASAWTGRNRHLENSGTLEHCQTWGADVQQHRDLCLLWLNPDAVINKLYDRALFARSAHSSIQFPLSPLSWCSPSGPMSWPLTLRSETTERERGERAHCRWQLRVVRCRALALCLGTQASHRSPDSEVPSINFVPVPSSELSARQKITCSPAITQKLKLVTIDSIKILD